MWINRPEADQAIANPRPGFRGQVARFHQKLSRQRQKIFLRAPVLGRDRSPSHLLTLDHMNGVKRPICLDRKSTRLNSSHPSISYAVFCLKKKKKKNASTNN